MVMYERGASDGVEPIDRWEGGLGWLAHPNEETRRASHAVVGEDGGAWVIDPLDGPGVDGLLAELGEVSGVAVLSNHHARDADALARRHDAPVYVPEWLDRARGRIDAPVRECTWKLGDSGFVVWPHGPLASYGEAIAYRESDGTLYVPELLGTAPLYTVGDERIGVYLFLRPVPPRQALGVVRPGRILVGHGTGVFEDAAAALDDALDGARRRFPRAFREGITVQLRALIGAVGE